MNTYKIGNKYIHQWILWNRRMFSRNYIASKIYNNIAHLFLNFFIYVYIIIFLKFKRFNLDNEFDFKSKTSYSR